MKRLSPFPDRLILLVAFAASLATAACTSVPEGSIQPLVTPGNTCSAAQRGTWQACLGADAVTVCAFQVCDLVTNIASECWQVTCPATVPSPVPGPMTGMGACDPVGSVNPSCTTTDGTLRPGYQYCDAGNNWGECIPYPGMSYGDAGPAGDGGMSTACSTDPEVLGMVACSAGLGVCASPGTWICNASDVKVCSATANEAARGSEGIAPDGLDNDCDGVVDNNISRSCFPFASGNPGVGICRYGTQDYNPATMTWTACTGAIGPIAEVPDNAIDEDCNGGLLFTAPCGGDPRVGTSCSAGIGGCMDNGLWDCVGMELVCDAVAGLPAPETCDNLDNDCDGGIDGNVESCYSGRPGSAGIGLCRSGTRLCTAGVFGACAGEVIPALEVCGNVNDEDCNGISDACVVCGSDPRIVPVPGACTEGIGACVRSGTYTCAAGVVSCNVAAGMSASETCNGIDDDCDGAVDETVVQTCYTPPNSAATAGHGICVPGTQQCVGFSGGPIWGSCTGEVGPATEICGNAIDEDCNDSDLGCSPGCGGSPTGGACTVGTGRCAATGTIQCVGGTSIQCVTPPPLAPIAETCNGIDDNCDGTVDNNVMTGGPLTQSCYPFMAGVPGLGICRNGTQTCSAGAFGACVGSVGPTAEVCDAVDNDCDGGVNEGLVCGGTDAGPPAPDAGMDAGPSTAGSCVGLCGSATAVPGSSPSCFCDSTCTGSGDCCGDYVAVCTSPDAGMADAGPPPADSGPPSGFTADQTAFCRADRLDDGHSGVVSTAYDLTCINASFGTCAAGWMAVIYDHNGCGVPSNPGVLSVSVDLANVGSGSYRLGLWCGSNADARVWPAPRNVDPICVTSYITAGTNRTSDGAVCPGAPSMILLPTFPANPLAPAVTCP